MINVVVFFWHEADSLFYYDSDPEFCLKERLHMEFGFCFIRNDLIIFYGIRLFLKQVIKLQSLYRVGDYGYDAFIPKR